MQPRQAPPYHPFDKIDDSLGADVHPPDGAGRQQGGSLGNFPVGRQVRLALLIAAITFPNGSRSM